MAVFGNRMSVFNNIDNYKFSIIPNIDTPWQLYNDGFGLTAIGNGSASLAIAGSIFTPVGFGTIPSNIDGLLQFKNSSQNFQHALVVGLSETLNNPTTLTHFFNLGNTFSTGDANGNVAQSSYALNTDVFKIERVSGIVYFYINDIFLHESTIQTNAELTMYGYNLFRGSNITDVIIKHK
jgi:hypothetical protein